MKKKKICADRNNNSFFIPLEVTVVVGIEPGGEGRKEGILANRFSVFANAYDVRRGVWFAHSYSYGLLLYIPSPTPAA